jgi:hypothetical protein
MLLGPQICVTAHKPGFEPAVQLLTVTERDHGETLLLRIVMARSTGRLRIDCVVMDVEGHVMPEATVTISKPPPAAGRPAGGGFGENSIGVEEVKVDPSSISGDVVACGRSDMQVPVPSPTPHSTKSVKF